KEDLKKLQEKIDKIIDKNGDSNDLKRLFEKVDKYIGKGLNRFLVLGNNLYFKPTGDISFVKEKKTKSLNKKKRFI
ncbi:MAG: cytochrome B, partial [Nautiliaceae bacterium]